MKYLILKLFTQNQKQITIFFILIYDLQIFLERKMLILLFMLDGHDYLHGNHVFGVKKIIKNIYYGMKVQNMKIVGEEP
jgi:hypothetical protein